MKDLKGTVKHAVIRDYPEYRQLMPMFGSVELRHAVQAQFRKALDQCQPIAVRIIDEGHKRLPTFLNFRCICLLFHFIIIIIIRKSVRRAMSACMLNLRCRQSLGG